MKPTKALQETLYKEMLGRIKQTDLSVPVRIGELLYYSRTEEGKQYPSMCRRKGSMDRPEEVLLDLNKLAEGHKFLASARSRSATTATGWPTRSTRPATGSTPAREGPAHRRESLERSSGSARSSGRPTTRRSSTRPKTRSPSAPTSSGGTSSARPAATLIYEEKDELFDVGAGRSLDKKMIFLDSAAKTSNEVRYLPGRYAGRRAEGGPAARGRPRVRRRSLQRRASTSRPTRARRTSASSPRRSTIRRRRTGSRSSSTSRRSRSTA